MNFRDVEHLSAYLDGQLTASETAQLETRLAADAGLRGLLDDLRVARGLLRRVPRRRAPRNFTLNPLNSRVSAPQPRAVPVLRYVGAIASLLFVLSATMNSLAPLAARSLAAAPPPGYGMGGGVGGGPPEAEANVPQMAIAPSGTQVAEAPAAPLDLTAPSAEALAKAAPPAESPDAGFRQGPKAPIPAIWMLILAIAGILFGGLSWYLDRHTRRNFRSNLLEK